MHPILLEVFGLKVYSYGVLVALAFLSGIVLMVYRAQKAGDNPDTYLEASVWFIIAGIVGARLFYFLWYPQVLLADPVGALFSQGGLVWYGGVIAVLIAALLYAIIKKISLFRFMDIIAPSAALGLAIGRIGCLFSGCCFGSACALPWAVHYPAGHETHGLPVHPVQLYETGLMLVAMFLLLYLDRKKSFDGVTTGWFFILAGLVRFVLEYIRGDRLVWIAALDLSASQMISIGGILLGIMMIAVASLFARKATPSV